MTDSDAEKHNERMMKLESPSFGRIVISKRMAEWYQQVGRDDLLEFCFISINVPTIS